MKKLSEMFMWTLDASRSIIMAPWGSMSAIRSGIRSFGMRFWPKGIDASDLPTVNYNITRSLYRNDGDTALGSAFCKPIVDLQVSFIGIPTASTDNELQDDFLNDCLTVHWADKIQEILRDSMRDSKTIVRIQRPDVNDPLMTMNEAEHCVLEVIPPEKVQIERDPRNKSIIKRAVISHKMLIVKDEGDVESGQDPIVEEHEVLEFITRDRFKFWDNTDSVWLDSLGSPNTYGFVNILEFHNEWDSALQDGQSEFESVIPFVRAFHELMVQGLQAHKYHSTPKVKLKLREVATFLRNNWPNVLDEQGRVQPNAEITWQGREILFFNSEEDAEFLEATSILGDTKVLAEFLIDCICIASQTPECAFMRVDSGSANSDRNAQTVPFIKKIERKRRNFARPIQDLLKMALVIQGRRPVRAQLSWELVRADDEVVYWQAFQQLVMGLETAKQGGEISDETYMRMLQRFLPVMKATSQEKRQARKDQKAEQDMAIAQATKLNGSGNPRAVPAIAGGPQGNNE
jgi:hypothetical protein